MRTIQEVMDSDVNILDFSVRSRHCMEKLNIKKLSELTALTKEDIAKTRNVGKKSVEEIENKLAEIGLWWKMTNRDWLIWGIAHIEWIKAN